MIQQVTYLVNLLAIFIITGCALLPSGRSQTLPQAQGGPTPTAIPTPIIPTKPVYEVQRGEVADLVKFNGRVAPALEKELFFRSSGRVRNVFVKRDDFVTAGQVLADLEIDDLERELASAQLDLERARQQLREAEQENTDSLVRAGINLEMAQAKLDQEEQDRLNDLAQARIDLAIKRIELAQGQNYDPNSLEAVAAADFVKARIAVRQAQLAYDEIAYADDLGSSSEAVDLQEATLEFERAQAAYDLALKEIKNHDYDLELLAQEVALAELKVEQLESKINDELILEAASAQLEVEILERGLDPIYKHNVERAELDVQKLEADINNAQIIAPFEGQILSESLTAGREANAFKPVVIIADVSEWEISADPSSSILRDVAEEMAVTATFASRPGEEIKGYISRLPYPYGGGGRSQSVEEEEDKSTRITLETSIEDLNLELGDLMQIEVILKEKDEVLWLPPQAIRTFEGRKFVVIQDGEAQRRVDVKIGIEGEDRVEIEDGLTEGLIVVGP